MALTRTLVCATLWCLPVLAQAADDAQSCNLMGREIALRAAEELTAELGGERRSQLAAIAEAVCLDYQSVQQATVNAAQQNVTARAAEGAETGAAEDEEEEYRGIRIIDPEDRVRRPGLKRQ